MRTWVERVPLGPTFAGKAGNDLDRIKAMKADGWDVTVLTIKGASYVLVLACR